MKIKNIRGFTLIETLVALSIFSVVVVAVYSAFSAGMRAREKGQMASDLYQEARIILDRMATEMRNMVRYSSYRVVGTSEAVSFPTLLGKGDHLEICYVTYYLETNEQEHHETLKRKEETPVRGVDETTDISSSVGKIHFDYGYRFAEEKAYQWSDSWDSSVEEIIPVVIRISLTLVQDEGQETAFSKTVHIPIEDIVNEGRL